MAAPLRKKIIDDGGSGPYKAVALTESGMEDFVIYRPVNLPDAVIHEGPLPLLVFANGGCNDTSLPHEKMLNDLASYGYIIVALGQMQNSLDDRELNKSPNSDMIKAIDWAEKANACKKSGYYRSIDLEYVALGGQSCGGAQVLANASDPRVKTYIMFNSGIGDMVMADANSASLNNLRGPILYILGGESDIAYNNALLDYGRIRNVPVAFANQLMVGHGGTFHERFGGSYSALLRKWLSWQFKDQRHNIDVFLRNRLQEFPDYTMMAKNFPDSNDPFETQEICLTMRDGKRLWGKAIIPNTPEKKKPFMIMAHGYNSSHLETQPFAECLAMHGIGSYIFDFCGGAVKSRSEGITTEMTVFSEKENLEDITKEVINWDFVDPSRLSLLGCSQGGLVASLTASANPDLYKSLVLVYPALLIPDTAPEMLKKFNSDNNYQVDVMGMRLGKNYYEAINGIVATDSLRKYKGEIFVVYGDKDMVIAGNHIDNLKAERNNCETLVIKDGTHGFPDYIHHQEATGGIIRFLTKSLRKQSGRHNARFDPAYPVVHDPVMAYENGVYYLFTTGFGIGLMSSTDMVSWKQEKSPLDPIPQWAKDIVPAYNGHTWAPDIIKAGDKWYLYYSCSTFGKNISAIGVATNSTLNPSSPEYKWEDQGMVINSQPGTADWNAIDPNVILDEKGNPWLTFGSFWDGIQLVKLKKDMKSPAGKPFTIARRRNAHSVSHLRPTANTNAIEAPFIVRHNGFYYLFVSYDYCCKGLSSNYKTAVGRSKRIEGPYLDENGIPMTETGGKILLEEDDKYSGIGHCSVYEINGKWFFIAHGYDKNYNGASKLVIREINWENGWPEIKKRY